MSQVWWLDYDLAVYYHSSNKGPGVKFTKHYVTLVSQRVESREGATPTEAGEIRIYYNDPVTGTNTTLFASDLGEFSLTS